MLKLIIIFPMIFPTEASKLIQPVGYRKSQVVHISAKERQNFF